MTSVNEVAYIWDGKDNPSLRSGQVLLSDEVNTYTYNHANRITAVSGPQTTVEISRRPSP